MMIKYTKTEKTDVLSSQDHMKIGESLKNLCKTSAIELTDEERENLSKDLETRHTS